MKELRLMGEIKLRQTVYCIYDNSISKEKIVYIGKDSFIVDDFADYKIFDSLEYFFNDYKQTWFRTLDDAKQKLLKENSDCKIKKTGDDYWEIQ